MPAGATSAAADDSGSPGPASEREDPRADFFDRSSVAAKALAVDVGDLRFIVDVNDQAVGRRLFANRGRSEQAQLAVAVKLLAQLPLDGPYQSPRGRDFIDVGANIGTTTLPALAVHGFARAIGCEPVTANARLLGANVRLNGLESRFSLVRAAVGASEGEAVMQLHPTNFGGHSVALDVKSSRGSTLRTEQVTLDSLVRRGIIDPERAGLLWIDAQGFEGHVVAGAQAITRLGVPIVCEYHPRMLDRSDALDPLHDSLIKDYTHFIDLRRSNMTQIFDPRPIAALPEHGLDLTQPETTPSMTDLLVVRLDGT